MKKVILTLVGIGMFAMQLLAYSRDAEATFTASEDRVIRVILDGRVMNRVPQRHVRLSDIRPGEHQVQLQVFGRGGKKALVTDHVYLRRGYKSKFRIQRHRRNRLKLYRAGIQPINNWRRDRYKWDNGYGKHKNKNKHGKHKEHRRDHYDDDYQSCGSNHNHYGKYDRYDHEDDYRRRRDDHYTD